MHTLFHHLRSLALFVALSVAATGWAQSEDAPTNATPTAPMETAAAAETPVAKPVIVIETSMGTIKAELWPDRAPATVSNVLSYVSDGFYDGTIFHRVINGFMIQGGGFTPDMRQKPTKAPVKNEAANGARNDRGTLAMARLPDPDSATAQFFINLVDNAGLNRPSPDGHGYCVFGKVTAGMDVVDKIAGVATASMGGHQGVPQMPVVITSMRVAD